jgi:hypothetical protein
VTVTTDTRRRFLERFEPGKRSMVMNRVLEAVRLDITDPTAVIAFVTAACRSRIGWGGDTNSNLLLSALRDHQAEARDLAAYCVWWEALPDAERHHLKEPCVITYRQAWLHEQPATERQTVYLASLGHHRPVRSRQQASELIEQIKGGVR